MSQFDRQYAIQLPDGTLFSWMVPEPSPLLPRFMVSSLPAGSSRPLVFDVEEDARQMLGRIQEQASGIGVTHYGGTIVSRVVGPWGEPDLTGFMAAVEGHANGNPS